MTEALTIPTMPEDWWPDEIQVTGRHESIELTLVQTGEMSAWAKYPADVMATNLEALRQAIWQAKHGATSFQEPCT